MTNKEKCKECGHYINDHMPKGYLDKGCCVIYRKGGKNKKWKLY